MKVNKMIGKAMAAAVTASMMLGSATVMADAENDLRTAIGQPAVERDHYPTLIDVGLRLEPAEPEEDTATLALGITLVPAETPEKSPKLTGTGDSIIIAVERDHYPTLIDVGLRLEPVEPEEDVLFIVNREPQEDVGEPQEDVGEPAETDETCFFTGDIIRIGSEPYAVSDGVFRIYFNETDYYTFTNGSFFIHNGKMILKMGGISVAVGSNLRALYVIVTDTGAIELHPLTPAQIEEYDVPEIPDTPVIPVIDDDPIMIEEPEISETPEFPTIDNHPNIEVNDDVVIPGSQIPEIHETIFDPEAPVTPVTPAAPVTPATPTAPAAPAAPASSVAAPAVSAPAATTQVAGAARLVAEGPGIEGFVTRLYTVALGREADPTGYAYWVEMLNTKQMTATEVADGFFNSPEFAARDLNNVEYLTVLYSVFFNREPDHNGLNHWVSYLQNGLLTREQVIEGFTNSREWINTCDIFGVEV